MLSKDINSSEIIKPILRGRDLSKYNCDFGNVWIINTHNGKFLTVNNIEKDIVEDGDDISVKINVKRVEFSRAKQIRINRVVLRQFW